MSIFGHLRPIKFGTRCAVPGSMSRYPRPLGEGLCYHVRMQCNNKAFRFQLEEDFHQYLNILDESRAKLKFLLHHYVIMHTHVHLILTTPGPALLDQVMRRINQSYAYNYHKRHMRYGHFWTNDYKCSVIDTDKYALACMRYLDRNPIRAGIVQNPQDWRWSAYQHYALGCSEIVVNSHPSYLGIAFQNEVRMGFYRDFVCTLLPGDEEKEQGLMRQRLHPKWGMAYITKTITS